MSEKRECSCPPTRHWGDPGADADAGPHHVSDCAMWSETRAPSQRDIAQLLYPDTSGFW